MDFLSFRMELNQMGNYELIWYDLDGEKSRDTIQANSQEEAIQKGYEKYNGNPPAKMVSAIKL